MEVKIHSAIKDKKETFVKIENASEMFLFLGPLPYMLGVYSWVCVQGSLLAVFRVQS